MTHSWKLYVPNALTWSRIVVSLIMLGIYPFGYLKTLLCLGIAGALTDFFDGRLARKWNCESLHGLRVDPWADKIFCWTMTYIVAMEGARTWPIAVPFAVYFAYDAGVVAMRRHFPQMGAHWFSKIKTVALMSGLLLWLAVFSVIPSLLVWQCSLVATALIWLGAYWALRATIERLRENKIITIPRFPIRVPVVGSLL